MKLGQHEDCRQIFLQKSDGCYLHWMNQYNQTICASPDLAFTRLQVIGADIGAL
jgi:hypothetical protein